MKYIESFREGERVSGIYLCKFRQSALTKAGKSYENLIFQVKQERSTAKSGIRIPVESKILMQWIMWISWQM